MRIIRATHLGMCFGVRDAIALALSSAEAGPLTILGELVHNPTVLTALSARGIAVANDVAQVTTSTLMVTAHGASARALASTRALGLHVVEATCPLVYVAHRAVAALVRDGYHVVIIGQRYHVTSTWCSMRRGCWRSRSIHASVSRRRPRRQSRR